MRNTLTWLGRGCLVVGILLIIANVALHLMGLSASYNIGDPGKFEFVLISFWHVGAALLAIAALAMLAASRIGQAPR
jgi:hypothetical protein